MNTSLYVQKVDGDREVLEEVTLETALEIFARYDWAAELAKVRAAIEAETGFFIPEFGLGDAAERALRISPLDAETISFVHERPAKSCGAESFPHGEAPRLITLFFEGRDDELAALAEGASAEPSEANQPAE